MNVKTLERFCKSASQTFFNEFGLISHQINSFGPPFDRLLPLYLSIETVEQFCKDASRTFFNEFGLISYQINLFDPCSDPLSLSRALVNRTGAEK